MPMGRFTDDQKKTVRHWAMEFIVVVAGVLLALWLQEWVEQQRALADMRDAEASIHDEVRTALEQVIWRKAISKCHLERQQLLKTMLLKSGDNWPGLQENALAVRADVPPSVIPSVYTRPLDTLTDAAWTSALTTGSLAPMDRERFAKLVAIYDQIETWRNARDDETDAVSKMSALAFPMRLTPELRAQMMESIYRVDRARFTFALVDPTDFAAAMRELGWDDTEVLDRQMRKDAAEINTQGFVWRSCLAQPQNPFRVKAASQPQ